MVNKTGSRHGEDAVLLFLRQQYALITPPVRRLQDFQKIALDPDASRPPVERPAAAAPTGDHRPRMPP